MTASRLRARWREAAVVGVLALGGAWVAAGAWDPERDRPLPPGPESAAAARALAGCYESRLSAEAAPRWKPLALVRMGPDGERTGPYYTRLDSTPEAAASAGGADDASFATYLVRDPATGASLASHNWWTPVADGGLLMGIRGWADYEEGIVHPARGSRAGAGGPLVGRWTAGGYRYRLVMRRVPCPAGPGPEKR